MSLSARRAWIEIPACRHICRWSKVALRKESVDRNTLADAWAFLIYVALRKESVDRNIFQQVEVPVTLGRSPQGERG